MNNSRPIRVTYSKNGLVSLELALSLLLSSVVLAIATTQTINSMKTTYTLSKLRQDSDKLFRVKAIANDIHEVLASHRFNIRPIIHQDGIIRFNDGTALAINRDRLRAPLPGSNSITVLEPSVLKTFTVNSTQISNNKITIDACPRFNQELDEAERRCFLAISSDYLTELEGELSRPDGVGCRKFLLHTGKSVSLESRAINELWNSQLILPIRKHFTIYLDKTGTLRYLSHCLETMIENQPVISGIEQLTLSVEKFPTPELLKLILTTKINDKRTYEIPIFSELSQNGQINFLLSRP